MPSFSISASLPRHELSALWNTYPQGKQLDCDETSIPNEAVPYEQFQRMEVFETLELMLKMMRKANSITVTFEAESFADLEKDALVIRLRMFKSLP